MDGRGEYKTELWRVATQHAFATYTKLLPDQWIRACYKAPREQVSAIRLTHPNRWKDGCKQVEHAATLRASRCLFDVSLFATLKWRRYALCLVPIEEVGHVVSI